MSVDLRADGEPSPEAWGFRGTRAMGAVAFAAEAHLPRERRLIVDASGLTLEFAAGIRSLVRWTDCEAVLAWPDRVELVVDDERSLVVRASEWHRGEQAVRALVDRVPGHLLVPMLEDPEPEPDQFVLRGMAANSGTVLSALLLLTVSVSVMGLGIGVADRRRSAVVVGLVALVGTALVVRALWTRLQVPRRWRDAAVLRGRLDVRVESAVATASTRGLVVMAVAAVVIGAALQLLWVLVFHVGNGLFVGLTVVALAAIGREYRRRRARRPQPRQGPGS